MLKKKDDSDEENFEEENYNKKILIKKIKFRKNCSKMSLVFTFLCLKRFILIYCGKKLLYLINSYNFK